MSLQLGANFPHRWLAAEKETRQQFLRELNHVCVLLDPRTNFDEWQSESSAEPAHLVTEKVATPVNDIVRHSNASARTSLPAKTLVELEQRLLKQAESVIERALDPIRAELKSWIHEQIRAEIEVMEKQG